MYAINYSLVIPVRAYMVRTYRQLNTPWLGTGAYSIAVRMYATYMYQYAYWAAYGQTNID